MGIEGARQACGLAREQAGAIGITASGNLFVTGTAARGVRQIDPRTELPVELRARPATSSNWPSMPGR